MMFKIIALIMLILSGCSTNPPKPQKDESLITSEQHIDVLFVPGMGMGWRVLTSPEKSEAKNYREWEEINDPVARPRGIRKAQVDAVLLLVCLDSLHTAQPHPNPLFPLQLQHNSHPSKTHHPTDLVSNPASS